MFIAGTELYIQLILTIYSTLWIKLYFYVIFFFFYKWQEQRLGEIKVPKDYLALVLCDVS